MFGCAASASWCNWISTSLRSIFLANTHTFPHIPIPGWSTRAITLKGSQGKEITVTAGPEVKNFAQMKVGDQVDAEYVEALTLELKKGGGKAVARTEQTGAAAAKPGERPAALGGRQVTIVADVIDVNAATQTVTLRGPQRTVELKVRDPEQFKLVAKGDQVEATYTEAIALAVSPAAKK